MRLVLFSLLLCAEPLLAQVPANQAGQVAIVSVDLTPDSPVSSQELQAVADEITKHTYFPRHLGEMVERARYTLQCDGYFKADVSLADTRAVTPDQTAIAITLAIREGYQYRLSEITFTGNKAVLTSELRNQFTIANGDVFDTEKIRRDLEGIRRVYVSRGYINFVPVPNTDTDDATNSVSLKIDVDEGQPFRFGTLTIEGRELHPGDRQKMLNAWKPNEGGVYN